MVDLICPKGMVLISGGNRYYPDEPPFCIHVTEVPQEDDNRFWAEKMQESGYQAVTRDKLPNGKNRDRAPLSRVEAEKAIDRNKDRLQTKMEYKLQPTGNSLGPRKPAVLRTWDEAKQYCQESYPGGDLPTDQQWYVACGEGTSTKACTASGELKKTEARIGEPEDAGPVDVDSYPPNANGVKNMTGNVREWVSGGIRDGCRWSVGGEWTLPATTTGSARFEFAGAEALNSSCEYAGLEEFWIGYRCIASPQLPK